MSNKTICPVCGKDSNYPSLWCSDKCENKDSKLVMHTEDRDGIIHENDLNDIIDDKNKAFKFVIQHAATSKVALNTEIFCGLHFEHKKYRAKWILEEVK